MKLDNHLLYIDITQVCDIGCSFCMYTDKHSRENMILTEVARENLSALINDKEVKRVSISGEGEPIYNLKVFKEILKLSSGGVAFEFITSGFVNHERLLKIYNEISDIIQSNGDSCNIRLSSDSYHVDKIPNRPHGFSIQHFIKFNSEFMSLSFRSIDIDKEFTRGFLKEQSQLFGFESKVVSEGKLEDTLIVDGFEFKVDYKNLVKPTFLLDKNYIDIYEYIDELEKRYFKPFTLGSMNKYPSSNGLDITIKPNGDVFLYGIECFKLGNIHDETISVSILKEKFNTENLIKKLYSIPFKLILDELCKDKNTKLLIEKVNNPYWIIKELNNDRRKIIEGVVG
ncbi:MULTISPECIES: radical SAM protein [unclassified Pseudoalteromonas]|uniref:radical SAM protein n=1 Tax=unclassified Pseudoalteromonas TaxID=194690 RepID=UPI00332A95D0